MIEQSNMTGWCDGKSNPLWIWRCHSLKIHHEKHTWYP